MQTRNTQNVAQPILVAERSKVLSGRIVCQSKNIRYQKAFTFSKPLLLPISKGPSCVLKRKTELILSAYIRSQKLYTSTIEMDPFTGHKTETIWFQNKENHSKYDWYVFNSHWCYEKFRYFYKVPTERCTVIKNAIDNFPERKKYKKGDKLKVRILEIKKSDQKVRVGLKQLEKDPFDWFKDKKINRKCSYIQSSFSGNGLG